MTGAYLFSSKTGERKPTEVEFLTDEERFKVFIDREPEEIIGWLNRVCNVLEEISKYIEVEGEENE